MRGAAAAQASWLPGSVVAVARPGFLEAAGEPDWCLVALGAVGTAGAATAINSLDLDRAVPVGGCETLQVHLVVLLSPG